MSGLIYCQEPKVNAPYYAKEIGVNLYSAEELSYYITHYVLLLAPDFLDESLCRFIGTELERPELEGKIRRLMKSTPDLYQGLMIILQDLHYCDEDELAQFRQQLDSLRRDGTQELLKKRGDFFLEVRQYGNAIRAYAQLLSEKDLDAAFEARVWHNRGVACAKLLRTEEAMDCLVRSWRNLKEQSIVKEMLALHYLNPALSIPDDVLDSVPGETQYHWQEEMDAYEKNAAYMGKAEDIAKAFNKDVIRRRQAVKALLDDWKQEYREMAQ